MTPEEIERKHQEDLQRLRGFRPIDDDFMRCLFKDNIPLAELVLRIITGKRDLKILKCEKQKDLKRLAGARSICLDAYATDAAGKKYDFVHLGSRGCEMDWLEDIFVLPAWQNKGIGSCAIRQVEDMVKAYSGTLYIEVAATNPAALQLYHDLGYTCLNTVTVRKDFAPERQRTLSTQTLFDRDFAVRVPSSDESE